MALHPDYPVVSGSYQMTDGWVVELPIELNRRIEDGSLVLWRPGLTFWIAVWDAAGKTRDARVSRILATADPARTGEQVDVGPELTRLTYELIEADADRNQEVYGSISGHVLSHTESVQISAYFDTPAARALGYQVIHSLRAAT